MKVIHYATQESEDFRDDVWPKRNNKLDLPPSNYKIKCLQTIGRSENLKSWEFAEISQ